MGPENAARYSKRPGNPRVLVNQSPTQDARCILVSLLKSSYSGRIRGKIGDNFKNIYITHVLCEVGNEIGDYLTESFYDTR